MTREQVLKHPAYWFEHEQNELFRQFHYYMKNEKINQTQLAERLGMTKGRVSQILRGESNFSMKTLIELGLSIGVIPKINYVPVEEEFEADELKRLQKQNGIEKKTNVEIELSSYHISTNGIELSESTIVVKGSTYEPKPLLIPHHGSMGKFPYQQKNEFSANPKKNQAA